MDSEGVEIMKTETEIERERIRDIVDRKCERVIQIRKNLKRKKSRLFSCFDGLRRDIFFSIDNPDYVRVKDRGAKT